MEIFAVEHLTFTYAGEDAPALKDVSLQLEEGSFTILSGPTGCGKSTLLRLMKREIAPRGEMTGEILFRGEKAENLSARDAAAKIGFVAQRPEEQIVTDRVWHEIAFGLENLGVPEKEMSRRVAETAQFFGLEELMDARTDELSGGQKQLLNLAAVVVMEPDVLILDEPTSKLDPIAARNFLSALERLNRETGMTILMVEHRLEDAADRADQLIFMDAGKVTLQGKPADVCAKVEKGSAAEGALSAAARIWRGAEGTGVCPLNVGEGRRWLAETLRGKVIRTREKAEKTAKKEEKPALEMKEVWFRFDRDGKDILRSVNLKVREGEIFAILGGNGSGKTTLLRLAAGLIRPYSGEVRLFGEKIRRASRFEGVTMMPQDSRSVFLRGSVRDELKDSGVKAEELPYDLSALLDRHPYDLSGGESQLLALSKALARKPKILLLDEPTGGLDAVWRKKIREILRSLRDGGTTIIMVTHDPEFAQETADRCAMLFQGRIQGTDTPENFFSTGGYYSTSARRMTRGLLDGCVTVEKAVQALKEAAR